MICQTSQKSARSIGSFASATATALQVEEDRIPAMATLLVTAQVYWWTSSVYGDSSLAAIRLQGGAA